MSIARNYPYLSSHFKHCTLSLGNSHVRRPHPFVYFSLRTVCSAIANRILSRIDTHLTARYARLSHAFVVARIVGLRLHMSAARNYTSPSSYFEHCTLSLGLRMSGVRILL